MNTIKTTFVSDLKVVTYCSLISEALIIALYFIIVSLANNIRDKEYEKMKINMILKVKKTMEKYLKLCKIINIKINMNMKEN